MTARPDAPELSAAERQRVDRIEAAPAAEESWDGTSICDHYCMTPFGSHHSRCGTAEAIPLDGES